MKLIRKALTLVWTSFLALVSAAQARAMQTFYGVPLEPEPVILYGPPPGPSPVREEFWQTALGKIGLVIGFSLAPIFGIVWYLRRRKKKKQA